MGLSLALFLCVFCVVEGEDERVSGINHGNVGACPLLLPQDTYRSLGVLTSSSTAMLIRMRIIFPVRDAVARILREEIHRFLRIVESLNEKAER